MRDATALKKRAINFWLRYTSLSFSSYSRYRVQKFFVRTLAGAFCGVHLFTYDFVVDVVAVFCAICLDGAPAGAFCGALFFSSSFRKVPLGFTGTLYNMLGWRSGRSFLRSALF